MASGWPVAGPNRYFDLTLQPDELFQFPFRRDTTAIIQYETFGISNRTRPVPELGVLEKKIIEHFWDLSRWIFRAEHQPRKRCSSGIVYAGMNAANAQKNFEKNRLEKSLEIKECEFFWMYPKTTKNSHFSKSIKNVKFLPFFKIFVFFNLKIFFQTIFC